MLFDRHTTNGHLASVLTKVKDTLPPILKLKLVTDNLLSIYAAAN